MQYESKDAALMQVLVERLEKQRLPKAQALKAKVERGEALAESEIDFLQGVFEDGQRVVPLLDRNPQWQPLAAKMINLYKQIIEQALENEKANNGSS